MTEKVFSFAIGDVVKLKDNVPEASFAFRHLKDQKERLVVTDVINDPEMHEYGINGSAWHKFEYFELVHRATHESLAEAFTHNGDEEEDIEDEDGDD